MGLSADCRREAKGTAGYGRIHVRSNTTYARVSSTVGFYPGHTDAVAFSGGCARRGHGIIDWAGRPLNSREQSITRAECLGPSCSILHVRSSAATSRPGRLMTRETVYCIRIASLEFYCFTYELLGDIDNCAVIPFITFINVQ